MVGSTSSKSSVSSIEFESVENKYYQLLDAFQELHKEAWKFQYSNNKYKSENNWLKNRIKVSSSENLTLKSKLKSLYIIFKNTMHENKEYAQDCENCSKQMEITKYLMKTLSKLTLGSSNLYALLGSQRRALNREGIWYAGKNNRLKTRNFIDIRKSSSIVCFYCNQLGHVSNSCYYKNFFVPKGKFK